MNLGLHHRAWLPQFGKRPRCLLGRECQRASRHGSAELAQNLLGLMLVYIHGPTIWNVKGFSFFAKALHQFRGCRRLLSRKIADSTLQLVSALRQSLRITEEKSILNLSQVSRIIGEKKAG